MFMRETTAEMSILWKAMNTEMNMKNDKKEMNMKSDKQGNEHEKW